MKNGKRTNKRYSLEELSDFRKKRFSELPEKFRKLKDTEKYKIGLSDRLQEERNRLIKEYEKK